MIQILLAPIKQSAVQLSGVDDVNSEHLWGEGALMASELDFVLQ